MGEPHWFVAYSHTLQWVGEAAHRRKWEARREALEIKASLLVCAFWCETDIDLTMVSVKHCWEPAPRTLHHQRENCPTTHVISYLDELAVCVPTREAWDQMVWPTMVVIPHVLTEAESYGYCQGQTVDLSPVMPATQFCVTEERGTYLCTAKLNGYPPAGWLMTCPGPRRDQRWPWPTTYCAPRRRPKNSKAWSWPSHELPG